MAKKSDAQKIRIMVFGTFDLVHKGHLHFFKQARKLAKNPFLIVSMARDVNVKKIKGRVPVKSENQRLKAIKKIQLVDKAVLGGKRAYIKHILREKPQIIALGYDQSAYTKNLRRLLLKHGQRVLVKRLEPYHAKKFKTSVIQRKLGL